MKAKEIRIGNWVEIINSGHTYTTIQPSCFTVKIETHYKPIKLTEEWLLKFGFVKNLTGFYEKGRLAYRSDYGWQILSQWVKNWVGVAPILYVHQLQNLFYSVCGEELNICK